MTEWIYPRAPASGAYEIDFAAQLANGIDRSGEARQISLAGVGLQSPGEWTMYFLRLTYLEEPNLATFPALVTNIVLQTGTDKGRGDLLGLERGTAGAGGAMAIGDSLWRGVAFHIAGGQMDATITYLPNNRLTDDRMLAWVAPGRPQITRLEGRGITSALDANTSRANRLRVPAFARRIRINITTGAAAIAVQPAIAFWSGPTFVTRMYLPVPAVFTTLTVDFIVPQNASHASFEDFAGPPGGQFVYFQYEIES